MKISLVSMYITCLVLVATLLCGAGAAASACGSEACGHRGSNAVKTVVPRVAAGLALEITSFAPAIGLLVVIIEIHRPSNYVGGGFLPPLLGSIASWTVLHLIGGALLLDALVRSRRILGLDPLGALGTVGIALYVMGLLSIGLAGSITLFDEPYGSYVAAFHPWLASMLTGVFMGIAACRNAGLAGEGKDAQGVTALPFVSPGGAGVVASF